MLWAAIDLGALAYWRCGMSAGVSIESIRGAHGTYTNGHSVTGGLRDMRPQDVFLNVTNQYALVGNIAALRVTTPSVFAIVRPISAPVDAGIAGVQNTGFNGYGLRTSGGAGRFRVGDGAAAAITALGSALVTDGSREYALLGTHDGATVSIYTDTVLDDARAAAFNVGFGATVNFYLAQWDGAAGRGWDGGIQHVTLFNRGLTPAEGRELFMTWRKG